MRFARLLLLPFAALACSIATLRPAAATAQAPAPSTETIAIIGTGSVGSTLGKKWAAAGHVIVYGSRTPDDPRVRELVAATGGQTSAAGQAEAAARADIVLVAVPAQAGEEVVRSLGDLSGKIIIDPMNSAIVQNGYIVAPTDPRVSIAERVQEWSPGATVVKAFNTLNYTVMEDPSIAGGPVTIPLASNDAAAKERVARLVRDVGLEPLDVGPLASARYLEEMLRLHLGFRMVNPGKVFDFHLRLHPE